MLASGAVSKGDEPHHLRVCEWKFSGFDLREYAEQGLFACYRIDIDAVAGEPSEKLWFTGQVLSD